MIINIGTINSLEEIKESPRNNWPHKNTMIAKGNVSNSGAFDEISPSLFSPLLRFMNEPVLSPTKQAKPKNVPRINAVESSFPILNHAFSEPVRGCAKILDSISFDVGTSPIIATISKQSNPEVIEPPIRPFHVFPSPKI